VNEQVGTVCPQCGSAAEVHSIGELAALARSQLGQVGQPGAAPQQQGWAAQPQAGPVPGWAGQPQAGPVPGWADQPQAGPPPGPGRRRSGRAPSWQRGGSSSAGDAFSFDDASLGDDIAGAALGAAAGFLGRAIGRRIQDSVSQRVAPAMAAMAAKREEMLRTQIAIAERHPDLYACLNYQMVFLAGGSRTAPMPNLATVTVEQADALVANLRSG
jgi:hypothetical protein